MSMQRLVSLIRKELIELRRDPRLFAIVIVAPLVQLTLLGYAATTDVHDVPLVVADEDRSVESRALISRFEASQNFLVADSVESASQIDAYLDSGRAWMALDIPARYGERIRNGQPVQVQVVADGSDANSTNVALGYAGSLIAGYSRELAAASGRGPAAPRWSTTAGTSTTGSRVRRRRRS